MEATNELSEEELPASFLNPRVSTLRKQSFRASVAAGFSPNSLLDGSALPPAYPRLSRAIALNEPRKTVVHNCQDAQRLSTQRTAAKPKSLPVVKKRKTHADLKTAALKSIARFTVSDLDPLDVIVRRCARDHKIPLNDAELILIQYKRFDTDGGGSIEYKEFSDLVRALSTSTVAESMVKSYWSRLAKEVAETQRAKGEPVEEVDAIDLETFLPWYYNSFGTPMKEKSPKSPKKTKNNK